MKKIQTLFSELDSTDIKIMKVGFKICFGILMIAIILLSAYLLSNSILLYNLGLSLFKLSTYIFIEFVICGIVADKVKKQIT